MRRACRRRLWMLALSGVWLLAVPAALSAPARDEFLLVTIPVSKKVTLVPARSLDDAVGVTLQCPKGYRFLDAWYQTRVESGSASPDFLVLTDWFEPGEASPSGRDSYTIVLLNTSQAEEEVTVVVLCGAVQTVGKPRRGHKAWKPRAVEKTTSVPAAAATQVTTACPAGSFPVSSGYRTDNPRVDPRSSYPRGLEWLHELFLDDPTKPPDAHVKTQTLCYPQQLMLPARKAAGRGPRAPKPLRVRFRLSTQSKELAEKGDIRVTATCKAGEIAVGGGYRLARGYVSRLGTERAKGSFSVVYRVGYVGNPPAAVSVTAVCVGTRIA